MNFLAVFIHRPVATSLLAIATSLAGWIAFINLPVAPLPQIDFPTIAVTANLPGATAETMAVSVATPLERSLGRIAGINEMTSNSSTGTTRITLQFDLNRDIDGASRDVQAAINASSSLLPINMPNRPNYRKVNPADSPVIILALTSTTMSRGQMYDAASTLLAPKIAQLPGVGQVTLHGSSMPAVRIELNPNSLAHYGISLEEVKNAITTTNANRPKGAIEIDNQHWQILANDQAQTAAEYLPIIVAYRNGAAIRIADLGRTEDSVEDLRNAGIKNGLPAVLLFIMKQPSANIIATVDQIKRMLPEWQANLPAAIELTVAIDRSKTIRTSVDEVENSLLCAIALIILVVLLFLRKIRSTLIPVITVPISLIGACAVMYLFDYSIDNLSLMALTIATGFVVDDAVVVLENASRHIEKGIAPYQAAIMSVKEVGFTVLAMSMSLIAVFIPVLLMGGIVGRLFHEFAVTLSAAVIISLLLSLTLTPMLCARWLKIDHGISNPWSRTFESAFKYLLNRYQNSLHWALAHGRYMLTLLMLCIGLNVYLYQIIPKGFFPTQDNGRLAGAIKADQSTSFVAMHTKLQHFVELLRQDPAITDVVGSVGGQNSSNSGQIFAVLKPPRERDEKISAISQRLRESLAKEPGANLFLQAVQELRIGGRGSAAQFEYSLQSDDLQQLRDWTPKLVTALQNHPELADVNTNQNDSAQQISLQVDREKASRLGISQADIDNTLNNAFGQRQVSIIHRPLNQYRVVMELAPEYWQDPQTLQNIYITRDNPNSHQQKQAIPLATIADFVPSHTPLSVNHQGQSPATTLSFNLKPGVSLSKASEIIQDTVYKIGMPASIRGSFQGSAKAFQESLASQPWLILTAILSIYIILGILYESLIHPITILSTLPSAGVGALMTLMAFDTEFTVIAMIGVLLLIGIVKKNAIMMIDCALTAEREQGYSPEQAIFKACIQRFRPIMMTTLAALLGALPLAFGSGYGAELRQPLGISIVGGLVVSQLLTLYTTPVVYLYLDKLDRYFRNLKQNRNVELP